MMEQKYRSEERNKQKRFNLRQYKESSSKKWSRCKPQTKFSNSNEVANNNQLENIQNFQNCSSEFKKICGDLKQVHLNRLNKLFLSCQKQNIKNENILQSKKQIRIKEIKRRNTQNTQNTGAEKIKVNNKNNSNFGQISKSLFNINTIKLPPNFFKKKIQKKQTKIQKSSIKTQGAQSKIDKTYCEIPTINLRKRVCSMQNLRKRLKIFQKEIVQQKNQLQFTFYKKQKTINLNIIIDKPQEKKNKNELLTTKINEQNFNRKQQNGNQNKRMIYKNLKYIHKLKQSLNQLKL